MNSAHNYVIVSQEVSDALDKILNNDNKNVKKQD
jgi:hypothetical protein